MSQADDMEAINVYMMGTAPKNILATTLKNEWLHWYDALNFYDKNFDGGTYDVARNKRNAFNLANVSSLQEEQNVREVIKGGITTEQMQGKTDRRDSNGMFPNPPPRTIPTWAYLVFGTVFLGVFGYSLASVARIEGR